MGCRSSRFANYRASPKTGEGESRVRGADARDGLIAGADSGIAAPQTSTVGFARSVRYSGAAMKVRNSLKSLRNRHRDNRLVRRKGRVYIINKTQKRFKARQG